MMSRLHHEKYYKFYIIMLVQIHCGVRGGSMCVCLVCVYVFRVCCIWCYSSS